MSAADIEVAARAQDVYAGVLAPLVIGGALRPVRPVGPELAREIAGLAGVVRPVDSALFDAVNAARSRRARQLLPVDPMPLPGPDEWLLLCALSDFLQVSNPQLPGVFTATRPMKLLDAVGKTLDRVEPPTTIIACLSRHATFAQLLRVTRIDTTVRWWTGSAVFRGTPPPRRLLAWGELRRVRTEAVTVTLEGLSAHASPVVARDRYLAQLVRFLHASPLTDLSSAGRDEPAFRWSGPSLSLVGSRTGARLVRRALGGAGSRADAALERATRALELNARTEAAAVASRFLDERRAHAALSP